MLIPVIVWAVMMLTQMQMLDYHFVGLSSSPIQEALSPSKSSRYTVTRKVKCDDINDDDDDDDDLKPILKILCQAGYNISKHSTEIDRSVLPKWSKILEHYGPPKILGLETCQAFREKIPPHQRHIAPAGMFNSGTNLLANLIRVNCEFEALGTNHQKMRSQVPWGKHRPFSTRANHTLEKNDRPYYQTLPVVSIRDPYTWLQSMCRQPYAASYSFGKSSCPNIVPYPSDIEAHPRFKNAKHIPVFVKYDKGFTIKYESMAHLWNEWYTEYIEFENANTDQHHAGVTNIAMKTPDFPFIVVRMEDLIFNADAVIPQMCECVGGTLKGDHVKQYANIANMNHGIDKSGGRKTGLLRSVVNYGNITKRRDGYPKFQLVAAKDTLDSRLMSELGYRYEEP